MKQFLKVISFCCLLVPFAAKAQFDELSLLDSLTKSQTEYTSATFKASRIVTAQSVEQMKEGQLEFRIEHRFGTLNSGFQNFYGVDAGTIFLSTEYGITDWCMVGLGRASLEKDFNGFVKLNLYRQSKGQRNFPFTITYYGATAVSDMPANQSIPNYFSSRLVFVNQLLIARKVNSSLSIQITPTYIHRNLVPTVYDQNDFFACGLGGRYKLTNRIALTAEYFAGLRSRLNSNSYFDPLSVGIDIETGGHVFSFMLTNSVGMLENQYIAENTGRWAKGDIHLGFNISRSFTLYGKK